MEAGDTFDISGYEMVAEAQMVDSPDKVLVMHNNSTHYLVAVQHGEEQRTAMLHASIQYGEDYQEEYKLALRMMFNLAMEGR